MPKQHGGILRRTDINRTTKAGVLLFVFTLVAILFLSFANAVFVWDVATQGIGWIPNVLLLVGLGLMLAGIWKSGFRW